MSMNALYVPHVAADMTLPIRPYKKSDPPVGLMDPIRELPMSILEFDQILNSEWYPAYLVPNIDKSAVEAILFFSETDPRRAVIRLLSQVNNPQNFRTLISSIVAFLKEQRRLSASLELDADFRLSDVLNQFGFNRRSVLVEMALPLRY